MVVATAGDYHRMKRLLDSGETSRSQTVVFVKKVSAIDNALIAVCSDEKPEARLALLDDIANKRGFEKGVSVKFYTTSGVFWRRKKDAIYMIAKMLELI